MNLRWRAVVVLTLSAYALSACSLMKSVFGPDDAGAQAQSGSWVTTPHAEEDAEAAAAAAQAPVRQSAVKPLEPEAATEPAPETVVPPPVAQSTPAPAEAPLATLPQEPAPGSLSAQAPSEDAAAAAEPLPVPAAPAQASAEPPAQPATPPAEAAPPSAEPATPSAEAVTPPVSPPAPEAGAPVAAAESTAAPAAAAAPSETASETGAAPQFVNFSISGKAHFPFRQSATQSMLKPGRVRLDELASIVAQMKEGAIAAIHVVGHSDRIGKSHRKELIAMRRAETVKEYLVARGVRSDLIKATSKSDTQPLVFCEGNRRTAHLISCLAPNRRVDVIIEGPK